MTDTISEEMYCLFTSPLNETWQDFLFAKSDSSFIFRTGFTRKNMIFMTQF